MEELESGKSYSAKEIFNHYLKKGKTELEAAKIIASIFTFPEITEKDPTEEDYKKIIEELKEAEDTKWKIEIIVNGELTYYNRLTNKDIQEILSVANSISPNIEYESELLKEEPNDTEPIYTEIDSKQVQDSDGFYTDYTLYYFDQRYVCIFGDKDIYRPTNTEPDFETENKDEAKEWFDCYKGFEDIEDSEGTQVTDIEKKEDYPKFKVGRKITNLVETHGQYPSSHIVEYYSSEKLAKEAAKRITEQGYVVEEIIPQGSEYALWAHYKKDEDAVKEESSIKDLSEIEYAVRDYLDEDYRLMSNGAKLEDWYEHFINNNTDDDIHEVALLLKDKALTNDEINKAIRKVCNIQESHNYIGTDVNESSLKEGWYDDQLPEELKAEIKEVIEELKSHEGYPCDEWKDKLWWQLGTVNNSNTEEERRNVLEQIKGYYEQYSKDKKSFDNAMDTLKRNNVHLWPHSIPRYENGNWVFTGMKGINHGQESTEVVVSKDGNILSEAAKAYNYIGTDVDEEPRDDKSHKERIFTVYDQYGEIGEYPTRAEAQKVIDEWYNDPELYGEEGPQLRIEEDIIDVLNNKITLPDDLG